MPSRDDKLTDGPPIVPQRDEPAPRGRGASRAAKAKSKASQPKYSGRSSWPMRLMVLGVLLIAAGAVSWSWMLQKDVIGLIVTSEFAGNRIAKLENVLTSTGESMNESDVAMQVKIKELYSEVDKLWASAWRRNKAKLEEHDKALADIKKQAGGIATNRNRLEALSKTQEALKAELGDAQQLATALDEIRTQQGLQEAVVGRLNRELDTAAERQVNIDKRLKEAEDWVQSNLQFRRETQRRLVELEGSASPSS